MAEFWANDPVVSSAGAPAPSAPSATPSAFWSNDPVVGEDAAPKAIEPPGEAAATLPDRTPTLGEVVRQGPFGVLRGIPNAIEGTADMLEKGTMQGFTNPDTGESTFSQLGRDLGIIKGPAPKPAPYVPKIGGAIKSGLNTIGLNPDNLPAPRSPAERVANMAGEGLVLAAAPEFGGLGDASLLGRIAGLARPATTGAISGAAGQGASEVVPDQYKPLANVAGALVGGIGAEGAMAAAKGTARGIGDYVAPLTKGGQEAAAGKTLANAATGTPEELISAIDKNPREIVPGSQPTTFQQTGDMGLGGLERAVAAQSPGKFNDLRATQNDARLNALNDIQSEGHPEAVSDLFRRQMDDIDQRSQAAYDRAHQSAASAVDQIGNAVPAEVAGNQARTALQAQLDASKAQESALWKAVDPDNSLHVVTAPVKRTVQNVYGDISPELATNLAPAEQALAEVVSGYGSTLPFARLTDLRSVVSQAMRAAKSPLQPNDMAYGRLSQLRSSIEDAISDSVSGKVAQEQQAVASGALAPEDTMFANWAKQREDWLAQRSQGAATGTGSIESLGPNGAGRSPSVSVSPRAAGTGEVGPTGNASASGLSENAGSGPLVDQGAADRLAEASAATKSRKEAFGTKPVANILQRPGSTYDYKMPSGEVAGNLWKPGPNGGAAVTAVLSAAKNASEAIEAIRSTAAASLRSKAANGVLTPEILSKWRAAHADALNALEKAAPGTSARFDNVERATENLATIARERKEATEAIQKSALGKIMKVSDPDDVTKTIGNIFGRNDSVKVMKEVADAARKDPAALEGLRKAVVDHMQSKLVGNTEAGTSGRNLIKSDQFQTFLGKNHTALRQVFSDEELKSMQAIAQDLKRANRSISAVKLPGGSNTAQDLAAINKHSLAPTLLNKLLTLASEGGATAAGSFFGPVGAVAGYVGAHVLGSLRTSGITKINDLVREAMLDPDLAKTLLMKAPKRLNAGSEVTLAHKLAKVGVLSGALAAAQQAR